VIMTMRTNTLCWNPMEAYCFTCANEDYNLYTYDMRHLEKPIKVHMDHVSAVLDVDYSPTGQEFVSASFDKTIRIFSKDDGHSREVYHTKRMQHVICIKWSADNKYILSGSDEMNIRLWKANAAEKLGVVYSSSQFYELAAFFCPALALGPPPHCNSGPLCQELRYNCCQMY
ncbi:DDB1- and CUL4-associated factor 13, partial [Xenoophorus captivus]